MEHQNTMSSNASELASGSRAISKSMQLIAAFFLGVVMLYGAGFVQTSAVHNAAHDVRHTLAFPCH